jgi:hypothetical protein
MPRLIHTCFVAAAAAVLASCAPGNRSADTAQGPPAKERMDDQYEVPLPRDTVPKVMQAKLAHAQAVLEGVVLADFAQIETNALALKQISRGGDWLVQESAAYFEFSAGFRAVCDDLVTHARGQDLQAAAADYAKLATTCVACHGYLRSERQSKDIPGRVSMDRRFRR